MKEAIFIAVAVVAFTAAAFVPGGAADVATQWDSAETEPRVLRVPPSSRAVPDRSATAQWYSGETTLDRAGDGHFYAEVSVNGLPVDTLVDTGASVVALTAQDAAALGLAWSESDLKVIGRGASGPVIGVPVRLERVQLGGHEASDVDAVILPDGLGITLLGQSFLSTVDPVRIEGDRMILGG